MTTDRREFLRMIGNGAAAGAAASMVPEAIAQALTGHDRCHADGGGNGGEEPPLEDELVAVRDDGLLRELEQTDLIVESDQRPSADQDDERRRYFALTPRGKRVLGAEVRRLEAIVHHARSSRALRKPQRA